MAYIEQYADAYAESYGEPGGTPVAHGTDVAELGDDGRLTRVTGFLNAA